MTTPPPPAAPLPPAPPAAPEDDPRILQVERIISHILRLGVWTSLALITLGTLLAFLRPDGYRAASLADLKGPADTFPRTLAWLAADLRAWHGAGLIVLGLLVLIATPILRVAISLYAFARQRDRLFVLITALVLLILLCSFLLGQAG